MAQIICTGHVYTCDLILIIYIFLYMYHNKYAFPITIQKHKGYKIQTRFRIITENY